MKKPLKTNDSQQYEAKISALVEQLFLRDQTIKSLTSTNLYLTSANLHLSSLNRLLEQTNQHLEQQIASYKRWKFGAKSEAMDAIQRSLFEETNDADLAAIDALIDQAQELMNQKDDQSDPKTSRKKRPTAVARQILPEHLDRQVITHEPVLGDGEWVKIGEEVKEVLDVVPAKFFVTKHIFPKYVQKEGDQIVMAHRPPAIIDGSYAAPGLLSWVVIGKYLDHLPLYRLESMASRDGVQLPRSTLSNWIGHVGIRLLPLYQQLYAQLLTSNTLHVDETPVDQLDPKTPKKNHKSYLWVYRTNSLESEDSSLVLFDYQTSRAGEHPKAFLKGFRGHLMVDDYSGYKALFKQSDQPVIELACWAHARRKFVDLYASHNNQIAKAVINQIAALYHIEAKGQQLCMDERKYLRQTEAIPILNELYRYLEHELHRLSPSSLTAKAIAYTLRRWTALTLYANSGHLPIDNNPAENAIRPIAVGRKNWLFIGSENAGKREAVIMSLLSTAKANGLDPASWLRNTLEHLPTCADQNIHTLLPIKGWIAK